MNSDDFEKRLQRQTFRKVPANWRDEILSAAKTKSVSIPSAPDLQRTSWWRELLWPCPQAWGGLAAVWLIILTLNFAMREPRIEMAKAAPPSPEVVAALREQRRLYLELAGMPMNESPAIPKSATPGPSSQHQQEIKIV